jgi:hypothetical protein
MTVSSRTIVSPDIFSSTTLCQNFQQSNSMSRWQVSLGKTAAEAYIWKATFVLLCGTIYVGKD